MTQGLFQNFNIDTAITTRTCYYIIVLSSTSVWIDSLVEVWSSAIR